MTKKLLLFILAVFALVCALVSCGKEEDRCEHEFDVRVSQEATCREAGNKTYTCKKCGEERTEYDVIPMLEHEWQAATCESAKQCKKCNTTEGYSLSHQSEGATCVALGKCKHCGEEGGYKESHTYEGTTDGTCKVCGYGVKFILPQTPVEISYKSGSTIQKKCEIESIKVVRKKEYSTLKYEITFIVESTYHKNGNSYSAKAEFGWKLYDEDGMVVTSGTGYSDAGITVGEKSKEVITFLVGDDSDDVQDGKTYRLELLNISYQ